MDLVYSEKTYRDRAKEKWDAIVIGSGLGGLTTASLMAKAGKKVLVLERHYVPGGFTHTFKRSGFEWDVGVHYVGQVHNPKAIMRRVFDYVSDGELHWASMGELYDRAIIEGDEYDFVSGLENQVESLKKSFPSEERAIRKYYKYVTSTAASSAWFFGEKTMPMWLSRVLGFLLRWKFERASSKSTYDVIRSFTKNERLISVLSAQCGDYGLPPKKSSFGIHAMVVDHYLKGASYPVGGASSINESILSGFNQNGGVLALRAEATGVIVENGRAVGVKMKSGESLFAPIVVSNAGARNTFQRLIPDEYRARFNQNGCLDRVKPSTSHVCLYVGLNGSDEELELQKHNLWLYDTYDFDKAYEQTLKTSDAPLFLAYLSFPSAKDPTWAKRYPGKSTIQIISGLPYEHVKTWEDKPWRKRGEDYISFKQDVSERLLEKMYSVLPQLRGRVEYAELSTPLSTRHFTDYQKGEIYGLEHTPERFRLRFLRPRTSIKGFYLTGQDLVSVGVGGALFSGVITAMEILKKPLIWHILRNRPLS